MTQKKKIERKIVTIKRDKKEWQEQIRKSVQQQHLKEQRQERKERRERAKKYKKYIPIPIVVGLLGSMIMWKEYGGRILLEHVLSWTIGITIIGTLMAAMKKL